MSALDNRIPPPIVGIVAAACMFAMARWWPVFRFELWHPVILGLAVAAVGGVFSIAGARAFRRAKTTVNPLHPDRASTVVTSGIYRFTRNPMYVGILLVLVGCFVAFGALSAVAGPASFVWYISRYQIAPEERVLEAKFGADYVAYRGRVRRWL